MNFQSAALLGFSGSCSKSHVESVHILEQESRWVGGDSVVNFTMFRVLENWVEFILPCKGGISNEIDVKASWLWI